jgi:hypothetical protein
MKLGVPATPEADAGGSIAEPGQLLEAVSKQREEEMIYIKPLE